MKKMWAGRTDGVTDKLADELNSSIKFDKRFYKNDIEGSIAHAKMLAFKNIITAKESVKIINGLQSILSDIDGEIKELSENIELDNYAELARRYTAENVCLSLSSLAVNGSDLMEIGLKGKEIGEWLDKLLDMVIDEKLPNERAALLSFVGEMKI